MDSQWERDRDSSAIDLSLGLHSDKLRSLSAPKELSWHCWRHDGAVTATSLRFYCLSERRATAGILCVLHYQRTQPDRHEDAAPVYQRFNTIWPCRQIKHDKLMDVSFCMKYVCFFALKPCHTFTFRREIWFLLTL